MTDAAYLALDLGSTELKAGLVAPDGRALAIARRPYPTRVDPATGRAEQDPAAWWDAIVAAVAELRAAVRGVEVRAICADGHGPTLVAATATGAPVRPAITWQDTRSGPAAAELAGATGVDGWRLGVLPHALWLMGAEPAAADAARWYLSSWDWLGMRLTGRAASALAVGQQLPDLDAVATVGLAVAKVPPPIATGELLGALTRDAADALGLPVATPVVASCVDAYASFFGAGLASSGEAIDTGGTSGGLGVYADRAVDVPGTFRVAAPLPGLWLYGGAMAGTGRALDWLRDDVLGGTADTATLVAEAAMTPPGADGLVFLPYLAGERAPIFDPDARAAFSGLSLAHGRGHLVRAVLEAAAFALRHVAEPIRAAGIGIDELRVSGGTARSATWNRIKADVLGVPVAVPAVVETALVGGAVIAAVGCGDAPDMRTAMDRLVRMEARLAPDPSTAASYAAAYATYVALYPALRSLARRPSVTGVATSA